MAGSINLGSMHALKKEDGIKIDQNHQNVSSQRALPTLHG